MKNRQQAQGEDLRYRERMKDRSRWVQTRSGSNRGFGRAFGVHESTASHWKAERVESGPVFQTLDALAAERTTTPAPLIAELEIRAFERQYADLTMPALVREFVRLRNEEHAYEADENRTIYGVDDIECGNALRRELLTTAALAALLEVSRRKYGKNLLMEARA